MSPLRIGLLVAVVVASACHTPHLAKLRTPSAPAVASSQAIASPALPVRRGVRDPLDPGDTDHDAELDAMVLEAATAASGSDDRPAAPAARWDKKTPPKYLGRIVEHLGLTAGEREHLEKNGFVALGRYEQKSYALAYYEVHRQELPLYVSADAILHALFRSHESLMMMAEQGAESTLADALAKMHAALPAAKASYDGDAAHDADLYLTVAERLLGASRAAPAIASEAEVAPLVAKATAAHGVEEVTLFGRPRLVDFSFYEPRGPYPRAGLGDYFRAMVWLSRLEMNVVSRGSQSSAPRKDPHETPREATLALVLADVARRAGTTEALGRLERLYRALSGPREAITLADLEGLGRGLPLGDAAAAAKGLRDAVGDGYRRTVNYHVRPYFVPELPAIATFFGVGITPDAPAITLLSPRANPRVVRGPDVAYALGIDRARAYVGADAQPLLGAARGAVGSRRGPDLYAAWFGAIRGLGESPRGAVPSFMETSAFADTRVASAMVAYGQIHHAYALHGVQVYDEGGCAIPDAYVEPAIDLYDAVLAYAERVHQARDLFPSPERVDAYTSSVELHVGALRAIARDELLGRALTSEQREYLAMVAEHEIPSGYAPRSAPHFNGWYGRLFAGGGAFEPASFLADYFTSTTFGRVSYVGARAPVLGIFVVDVGGEPRAMVGPVARAYEAALPLSRRVTDEDDGWSRDESVGAWERSYLAPASSPPRLSVSSADLTEARLVVDEGAKGDVVVEQVDEHGDAIARSAKVHLSRGEMTIRLAPVASPAGEGASPPEIRDTRVRLGDGTVWSSDRLGY